MKICDIQSGLGQLAQAFSQFNTRWTELKPLWRDETGQAFEEHHIQEIPANMKMLMNAASRLADSLDKAVRDCEEPAEPM